MKILYKIVRVIVVTLLLVLPAAAVTLYVALSLPVVQEKVRDKAVTVLSDLLGTNVTISGVEILPFNRVVISDAVVRDSLGNEALHINHLGAGVSMTDLILRQKLVVSYAELIGFKVNFYRDSVGAPLNVDPIFSRLKGDGSKSSADITLAIRTIVMRHGVFDYNVLDAFSAEDGKFDKNHISVADIRADVMIPAVGGHDVKVDIKRLAACERSGLEIKNLRLNLEMNDSSVSVSNMELMFNNSKLCFDNAFAQFSPLGGGRTITGDTEVALSVSDGTTVSLSDLAPFVAALSRCDTSLELSASVKGTLDNLMLEKFVLQSSDGGFEMSASAVASNMISPGDMASVSSDHLEISADGGWIAGVLASMTAVSSKAMDILTRCGTIDVVAGGVMALDPMKADAEITVMCDAGSVKISGDFIKPSGLSRVSVDSKIVSAHFDPSVILGEEVKLSDVSLMADAKMTIDGYRSCGDVDVELSDIVWDGTWLGDYKFTSHLADMILDVNAQSDSEYLDFVAQSQIDFSKKALSLSSMVESFDSSPFIKSGKLSGFNTSFAVEANVQGSSLDDFSGSISISDMMLRKPSSSESIMINNISLVSGITDTIRSVTIKSDIVDADVSGNFRPSTLKSSAVEILSEAFPALIGSQKSTVVSDDEISLSATFKTDTVIARYFNMPVEVIHPVTIAAYMNSADRDLSFSLHAPFLWQKGKLIEQTRLTADVQGASSDVGLNLSTVVATKNGPMQLTVNSSGHDNHITNDISWKIRRRRAYYGNLSFDADFEREQVSDGISSLITAIDINPSVMVFNDTAWTVAPSRIDVTNNLIKVKDFVAGRDGQYIKISGQASADSTDVLHLKLKDINLDYVFETLNISNVSFGGNATGDFYASQLLSGTPVMFTDNLFVKGLSYNGCVMGDGRIKSAWHNADKAISIYADIAQSDGRNSVIDGLIRPISEELDFKFYCDRARIGFLKPFMSAFASDISGYASGFAHLYGTFKFVDLKGSVLAEDVKMKLSFTNTSYTVRRDSVRITPGNIRFNDVTLTDRYGKTALLSGVLHHKFFKEPDFKFNITDAENFLCYDVSKDMAQDPWYGKVFGNGGVTITGYPGMVDIKVKMSTAPKSNFTFVLSDEERAADYHFITFTDRDRARKDSIARLDTTASIIRDLNNRKKQDEQGPPTDYRMNFDIDITPQATLNIIMDPVGGDKIVANGKGNMDLSYASNGELKMNGRYTIDRGRYNFTLQDVIIKDFTIREGSSIKFNGNPYAAILDIKAAYSLNANLTDLDESFRQDKDLNRTSVPVNAMLLVTGDMRRPEIDFDLEFPTLTRDVYRKVRSIVSTKDMMNRQIIYLLALNRFYTPDYMNATRGNELVSVASSTISSQLSSMLGQLSDKWTIAPNFRSDRGDFSDVEVDLALSSHLLNNRLLLNGNFGYRDKSMNNNSFIGDFDIRYLLNNSGSLWLKAYNRYNDQNYYLKSALTTQGLGIVYKRDFDNIFSFLRPLFRKKPAAEPAPAETAPTDSIK